MINKYHSLKTLVQAPHAAMEQRVINYTQELRKNYVNFHAFNMFRLLLSQSSPPLLIMCTQNYPRSPEAAQERS